MAILGGTQAAWRAKLGTPDSTASTKETDAFDRCGPGTPMPTLIQWMISYTDGLAATVNYQSCTTQDRTQSFVQAAAYLPKDAKVQGPAHPINGEDDYLFVSPSLASEFPASVFMAGCPLGSVDVGVDDTGWTAILGACPM